MRSRCDIVITGLSWQSVSGSEPSDLGQGEPVIRFFTQETGGAMGNKDHGDERPGMVLRMGCGGRAIEQIHQLNPSHCRSSVMPPKAKDPRAIRFHVYEAYTECALVSFVGEKPPCEGAFQEDGFWVIDIVSLEQLMAIAREKEAWISIRGNSQYDEMLPEIVID